MTEPTETRNHPDDPRCVECEELLGLFVGSRLSREADPRFRELLRGCEACRDAYRRAITQTAAMARGLRETRERRALDRERSQRLRRRIGPGVASNARQRRFYWQLMIVPALLIWLLTRIDREHEAAVVANLVWEGGGVSAAGTQLDGDIPLRELHGGDLVELQAGARARIEEDGARIVLEGSGTWLVEPDDGRFRLYGGSARVETDAAELSIVTARAIVTFAPRTRATLASVGTLFEVHCEEGSVRVVGPTSSSTVGPGERWPAATAGR